MEVNITIISVLVVIFLFIPGFFFKRFYYSGQFAKQFHLGSFAERFITSLFWGMVVQCISIIILGNFGHWQYNNIRSDLNQFYGELKKENLPACSGKSFDIFIGFLFFTSFLAMVMGFLSHKVVRLFRLDVYIPALRFSNQWNYYFKGDLHHMRDGRKKGKVISTIVDVLVRHEKDDKEKTRLYRGFLNDYTISHTTGELENIVLSKALRWSSSATPPGFKPVPGDNLIILYSTVLNLNVTYNTRHIKMFDRLFGLVTLACFATLPFVVFSTIYYYYGELRWWRIICLLVIHLIMWLLISTSIFGPFAEIEKKRKSPQKSKAALPIYMIIATAALCLFVTFLLYKLSNLLIL